MSEIPGEYSVNNSTAQINLTERSAAATAARQVATPARRAAAYLAYWIDLATRAIATPANPYIEGSDLDPAFLAPQLLMLQALEDWLRGKADLPPGATWWLQAAIARREEALQASELNRKTTDEQHAWAVDELAAWEWLWTQVRQVQPISDDISSMSLHGYGGTL